MNDSPTDAALVRAVRRGKAKAFETLVRRHLKVAHRVALGTVAVAEDADDVVQDAFMTVLNRLDSLEDPAKFRPWLLTIVRNRAHNLREFEARRRGAPLEEAEAVGDPGDRADREVERMELREQLRRAMDRLTEVQRKVLLLYDYEGWTHKEIAGELGFSNGASRFHLSRARHAMRVHLSEGKPG